MSIPTLPAAMLFLSAKQEPRRPSLTLRRDATAIWFAQMIGREIRIIDYYEASGVDLGHYVRELAARPFVYAGHIVPHDAQAKELGTGKSRLEVLESLGVKNLQLAPLHRLEDGINAVRVFLPKMLVRCRKMRARHRRAQALSRAIRRQAAGAAAAAGARLDLACRRCVSLPRAHARSQGDPLGVLPAHRLSAARRGVIAQSGGRHSPGRGLCNPRSTRCRCGFV
jgi:hypothetical protein